MGIYLDSPPPSWYDPPDDRWCRGCFIEEHGLDAAEDFNDFGSPCRTHAKDYAAYNEDYDPLDYAPEPKDEASTA